MSHLDQAVVAAGLATYIRLEVRLRVAAGAKSTL